MQIIVIRGAVAVNSDSKGFLQDDAGYRTTSMDMFLTSFALTSMYYVSYRWDTGSNNICQRNCKAKVVF